MRRSRHCAGRWGRKRWKAPAEFVARELDKRGVGVAHILAGGRLESHRDAMDRLIEIAGLPPDGDLFRPPQTREELVAAAVERQVRRPPRGVKR